MKKNREMMEREREKRIERERDREDKKDPSSFR